MPGFAVVSVRASDPAHEREHVTSMTGDAYRGESTTLHEVMTIAFGLGYEAELAGEPAWVKDAKFDIEARLDEVDVAKRKTLNRDDGDEQMRLMLQTMLAERFHLKYHFETRALPVYELQVAKGGLKCPEDTAAPHAIPDMSQPRFRWFAAPAPPPSAHVEPVLAIRTRGWPWWLVVSWISHQQELDGRPVMDRTGLSSSYDCQMKWMHGASDDTGEYFFSALEHQLGLKLVAVKGPVEVLVVDGIDKPSAN